MNWNDKMRFCLMIIVGAQMGYALGHIIMILMK